VVNTDCVQCVGTLYNKVVYIQAVIIPQYHTAQYSKQCHPVHLMHRMAECFKCSHSSYVRLCVMTGEYRCAGINQIFHPQKRRWLKNLRKCKEHCTKCKYNFPTLKPKHKNQRPCKLIQTYSRNYKIVIFQLSYITIEFRKTNTLQTRNFLEVIKITKITKTVDCV
jgi:hypothetical protein